MNYALRSVENALFCLAAQISLEPIANDYVEAWEECIALGRAFPSPEELVAAAEAVGVPVVTDVPLYAYLDQCVDDRRIPDPRRIVECIVHGYAELRYNTGRCPCPARRTLAPKFNPKPSDIDYPPLYDPLEPYSEDEEEEEGDR